MTNAEIDAAAAGLVDLLKIGASVYPPLAIAAPLLEKIIQYEANHLKVGIAAGTIVSDGHGGLIPAHGQSYFDPKTGKFTGKKT